jgi:hypothetical protein
LDSDCSGKRVCVASLSRRFGRGAGAVNGHGRHHLSVEEYCTEEVRQVIYCLVILFELHGLVTRCFVGFPSAVLPP